MASIWASLLIPTVPRSIRTLAGFVGVTEELHSEIERTTSMSHAAVKIYDRNQPDGPHRTWVAFSKAPRHRICVFNQSGLTRKFKKQEPLDFFKRCDGNHPTKYCSSAPSCGNYGSIIQSKKSCTTHSQWTSVKRTT